MCAVHADRHPRQREGRPSTGQVIPTVMLADLVSGGGCVAEGSDANNPLARFSRAVLDSTHQRDVAGSSQEHELASIAGLSQPGIVAEMGPSEAAFMQAYEGGLPLQLAWEQAAASGDVAAANQISMLAAQQAQSAEMMQAEAAWRDAEHAMQIMQGESSLTVDGRTAGNLPHSTMHHLPPMHHPPMLHPHMMPPPMIPPPMMMMNARAPQALQPHTTVEPGPISRERVRELDEAHEAAWSKLAAQAAPSTAVEVVPPSTDLEAAYIETLSRAMGPGSASVQHAQQASMFATEGQQQTEAFGNSFEQMEKVWRELSLSEREAGAIDGGSTVDLDSIWETLRGGDYDASAWASAWESAISTDTTTDAPYRFHEQNAYDGGSDLLARGTALFERGELREAVLALEAAIKADPENTVAWQTLGQAHADADDDGQAIACLRRAVEADPHNLDALLALGVSYTNELDQTRALHHLQLWLESHPDFAELSADGVDAATVGGPFALQRRVTDLFLRAVKLAPENADLHAVLGVLYNLSRSYPDAIGAFEAALRLRPADYSLWNKLGATQANAMSCTEALPCYIKALQLKPQYVRALSNLGISYGNVNDYTSAAQCYLKALSLNPEATHVWGYLTMTFTSMGRPDLVDKAAAADHTAFAADFDFQD